MPVNGKNGTYTALQLASQGGKFFTFSLDWVSAPGNIVPSGTVVCVLDYIGQVSNLEQDTYIQAPGDTAFVAVGSAGIEPSEWQAELDVMDSAQLGAYTPPGATATCDQLGVGQGQWTNPDTGAVFTGQQALGAWIAWAWGQLSDLVVEQDTQEQWGSVFCAKRRASLRQVLANAQITPFVPTTPPSEGQVFPPGAKDFQNALALCWAQSLGSQIVVDSDGGPTFALNQPPA